MRSSHLLTVLAIVALVSATNNQVAPVDEKKKKECLKWVQILHIVCLILCIISSLFGIIWPSLPLSAQTTALSHYNSVNSYASNTANLAYVELRSREVATPPHRPFHRYPGQVSS